MLICAVTMLVVHAALLGWASYVNSPNLDEPAHLASGLSHWKFGRFDLYRVNPPLVRMVAAAPILATDAKTDWSGWIVGSPYARSEFHAGTQFVILNGEIGFWYFTLARWACIPLCLVGVWVVYAWSRELFGPLAGLTAMSLYCFCPNSIAWGASITPDAAGASIGVLATYAYWRWLRNPSWNRALLAGMALGFAELVKGTWVILFVLWPLVWLVQRMIRNAPVSHNHKTSVSSHLQVQKPISPPFLQMAVIVLIAVYQLNLGFGFEGTFKRLGDFKFVSRTLSGQERPPEGANRFSATWFGAIPVPFPENYIRGLDVQKSDFERGRWSYLCGEQKKGGWWYYYLFAFLVKSPIGTLTLFALATVLALCSSTFRSGWRNEFLLWGPALVVFVLVSSQTGFSRYLRYALPVLPFACIHASRIVAHGNRNLIALAGACCLGTAVESLAVFPHSMSFFNVAVGGPTNGNKYLLDANIDWGQDLLFLKHWYDANPDARPLHLVYFGDLDVSPAAAGIVSLPVPGYLPAAQAEAASGDLSGPQPGWFAVSINHIQGYHHYETDVPKYTYFQQLRPVAKAGHSIYIFHLTLDEANELRSKLGLKPIP